MDLLVPGLAVFSVACFLAFVMWHRPALKAVRVTEDDLSKPVWGRSQSLAPTLSCSEASSSIPS